MKTFNLVGARPFNLPETVDAETMNAGLEIVRKHLNAFCLTVTSSSLDESTAEVTYQTEYGIYRRIHLEEAVQFLGVQLAKDELEIIAGALFVYANMLLAIDGIEGLAPVRNLRADILDCVNDFTALREAQKPR
jgi:hypothetical protein